MGTVSDIVGSGVSGWQGLVNSATTKLDSAKSMLSTALQSYIQAASQQSEADQAAEQVRQFEKNYGLDLTKINNQVDQFNQEMSLKKNNASSSSTKTNQALSALQKDINAGVPFYELYPRYKDVIPEYQIRQTYNAGPMAKIYGGATESSANLGKITNLDSGAISGYASGIQMGSITMSSVPEEYRNAVANALNIGSK
jgi:hypothetical protein